MLQRKKYAFISVLFDDDPCSLLLKEKLDSIHNLLGNYSVKYYEYIESCGRVFNIIPKGLQKYSPLVPNFYLVSFDDYINLHESDYKCKIAIPMMFSNENKHHFPSHLFENYGNDCKIISYDFSIILDFVEKALNQIPPSIIPLNNKFKGIITKLLLLIKYPSTHLSSKNISYYMPKLLFIQKIILPLYSNFLIYVPI